MQPLQSLRKKQELLGKPLKTEIAELPEAYASHLKPSLGNTLAACSTGRVGALCAARVWQKRGPRSEA